MLSPYNNEQEKYFFVMWGNIYWYLSILPYIIKYLTKIKDWEYCSILGTLTNKQVIIHVKDTIVRGYSILKGISQLLNDNKTLLDWMPLPFCFVCPEIDGSFLHLIYFFNNQLFFLYDPSLLCHLSFCGCLTLTAAGQHQHWRKKDPTHPWIPGSCWDRQLLPRWTLDWVCPHIYFGSKMDSHCSLQYLGHCCLF